jgi:DNA invertase Pin-like site-specific DNA recombinase
MAIRAAIYARTSPDCAISADKQVQILKSVAELRGWTIEHVLIDRPTTARGPDRRPGEVALISAIRSGVIEKVLVWSIDRVGHSLAELIGFLESCRMAHVSLWVDQQGIDTEQSSVLFNVAAVMAVHLRQSRRDKILRGQLAAWSLSIRFGRPALALSKIEGAKRELAAGRGVREAARLAGISAASVSRIKNSLIPLIRDEH